ncbi:secreted RxLR effector protein 161-like [Lathyrus oleraceus]|uniref:secreted RxLR effector protein 161-like n=1 Tax=Pisum sativum TaxID=3888 RepID=UPI0021D3800D|nr:secreted RxLR effector protein 161-like [Pisum sativum]
MKRILRNLKGTLDYGILFPTAKKGKECKLAGFTDSSWCSDTEDRKFISSYVFILGGVPDAWSSRKKPLVALSSCEVEYKAVSLCPCHVRWMVNLVKEIKVKDHGAITMKIDNIYAANVEKNPIAHRRSKHIKMRFYYLREQLAGGKLNLEHCRTENWIANIMMNGVQVKVFKKLRSMMNVDCLDTMNYVMC